MKRYAIAFTTEYPPTDGSLLLLKRTVRCPRTDPWTMAWMRRTAKALSDGRPVYILIRDYEKPRGC